jgi:predicted O-linked N-acetylglucosamine transferase (SPINDLY family)
MDIAVIVAEGRQLQRTQRLDEALACFTQALALDPDHLEALGNRGSVLGALQRYDEALRDYDRALTLVPNHAMLLYNRGSALMLSGRPAEAVESFDQALALNPDAAEIWNNRGNALRELNRALEAIASYDRAIALRPDYAKAFYNRGNAHWVDLKQIEPALENFERAFAIDPECDNLRGDLLHLRMHVGDWRDFEAQKKRINQGVKAGRRVVGPFAYQAIAESPADLQACSMLYAAGRYPARTARGPAKAYSHEKIRIGYLCGEFRKQATSFLTAGLYEQHDRGKFHIAAYDNGWSDDSPLRHRLEKSFDAFTDISGLSDRAAAEKIAADEIDILVNLNGYFGGHRMGVFASRAAPVQVNYLGFPATLGAPYMDYILADKTVIPEQERPFYTEQVVYLPVSYQVNDSKRVLGKTPVRADHALPADGFVFCNFNQSYKLTPDIFAGWMRILKQVPGSLLWLLEGNPSFPENIRRHAQHAGVAPERIVFAPMIDAEDHLARIQLADLFLDTAPYNAHTTGSDALWAGVPLITARGTTFPGRVAASLLTAAGLPELITADLPSYETLAVTLAREPERLKPIRQKLQTRSALFDTARFALAIEAAFTRMAEISRAGRPAQGFSIEN